MAAKIATGEIEEPVKTDRAVQVKHVRDGGSAHDGLVSGPHCYVIDVGA
jgi:hypothetical protein